MPTKIASPCQRNCCLNSNDICLGCFRSLDEITQWHESSEIEKKYILKQTQQRQQQLNNKH